MKEAFIFDLDSKVSIYVPSTTDVNKADNEGLQERFVNLTIKEFSELFGGATATDAIGGWFSKEKGIVTNVDATNVDITITNNCGETTGVGGLIGYAVNSTISGCDLSGCDIDLNGTDTQNVGGLIGRLRAEASSVTDCSVANATLSARYCAGGLIGKVGCTTGPVDIKGNTTSGMTVSFRDSESGSKQGAGGLIGLIEATGDPAVAVNVGDASNPNTVSSLVIDQTQGYVGGVVGNIMDGNVTITKATVSGNIATTGYYAAGVLGRSSKAVSISYCDVYAIVSAGMGAGGVLGYVYEAAPTISHCTVAGSVTEQPALTLPSADVTMMTHTPGPFAITLPVWSTVATALSELSQVRVLSVAFSGSTVALTVVIPPGSSMRCSGSSVMLSTSTVLSFTVMLHMAENPPSAVETTTEPWPGPIAVTSPP